MWTSLVSDLIIMCVVVNRVAAQCLCNENKVQARCVYIDLSAMQVRNTNQKTTNKMSSIDTGPKHILPANGLPFKELQTAKVKCDLLELTTNSFANQDHLKNLDLSENFISKIPTDLFEFMPLLEKLNFSHNNLEDPTLDTFYALNNLKILDVSNNKISNLLLGVLDEMQKLEKLYLHNNLLPDIKLGVFDNNKELKLLDLSYNRIGEIPLGLFDQSKELVDVNLSGNDFNGEIPLGTYDSFINVKTFILRDCKITKLPLGIFDETIKLSNLDLSRNEITKLDLGIFDRVIDLKYLNLGSCKIADLPNNLYKRNVKLEKLDLSSNQLHTLPNQLFRLTEELKYLNLSYNQIVKLPIEVFQYTSLIEIDISHNKFETIEPDLLNMETLEKVHAQNNQIHSMDALTFATSNFPLKYLDVRNNRLVFIDPVFFEWVQNLERMEIFGNPWDCKCLEDLVALLAKKFIGYTVRGYYDGQLPVCVSVETKICNINIKNITSYYDIYQSIK